MRDQDYAQREAAGTLRIALLGPSHVMGNGVADGETFEALVEDRLNRELKHPAGYQRVEILNFGVDGYSLPQQLAMLEDRVLAFSPDLVIATHYHRNRDMTERYLAKIVWGGVDVAVRAGSATCWTRAGLSPIDRGTVCRCRSRPAGAVAKLVGLDVAHAGRRSRGARPPDRRPRARLVVRAPSPRLTRAHGARPALLALNAVIDDVPPRMSEPKRPSGRRADCRVIDLFDDLSAEARPSLRVAPWDDHPNAEGHRLIADRFYGELVRLLDGGALDPSVARAPRCIHRTEDPRDERHAGDTCATSFSRTFCPVRIRRI